MEDPAAAGDLDLRGRHLVPGRSVMERLSGIKAPTLVIAGKDDFIFPPESQRDLAAGIPGARLLLIDRAGHNPQFEQPARSSQRHDASFQEAN